MLTLSLIVFRLHADGGVLLWIAHLVHFAVIYPEFADSILHLHLVGRVDVVEHCQQETHYLSLHVATTILRNFQGQCRFDWLFSISGMLGSLFRFCCSHDRLLDFFAENSLASQLCSLALGFTRLSFLLN